MPEWQTTPISILREPYHLVFSEFRSIIREVWRNADFVLPHVRITADPPVPPSKALAQVRFVGNPRAIGDSILQRASHYTLHVAARFFDLEPADQRRVLIHEAVHLGIPNHGAEFRAKTRKHGGTVSEESLTDPGIFVEKKMGSRYKRIGERFDDEHKAEMWVREQLKADPSARFRLALGGLL